MALAPCLIGYGAIAKRLYTDAGTLREGNQFWKWIENYVAEDYSEAVRLGSGKRTFRNCRDRANLIWNRTAGKAHEVGISQSHGGVDQDFHSGYGAGD
jgi:hypothetical protein